MKFDELTSISTRPSAPQAARRVPISPSGSDTALPTLSDDIVNNGFVTGVIEPGRASRMRATRRTFLRSTIAATAAGAAVSFGSLFGASRRVQAQTGVVGSYPRRILTFCPPYNANDNCQPGCGSSPICTDCCGSDGFFRNDPGNGYSLYPGGCGDGDIADGWLWRFNDVCGSCGAIEYRCSDGYVQTDTGPAPFICRQVTDCEPLPDGVEGGPALPDAARDTDWSPAGALEQAVDNGGTVTISGWIADASQQPIDMRLLIDGRIAHIGKAALNRPDVAASVRGASASSGYAVNVPVDPGTYTFCVHALKGALSVTIGCVTLNVGSGQSVRGDGANTSIAGAPTQETQPETSDSGSDTQSAEPPAPVTDEPAATPTEPFLDEPVAGPTTDAETRGAAQIIRRNGATTGFASGWAADPDTDEPVFVDIVVDGVVVATTRPELPRPDVAAAFPTLGAFSGWATSFELPEAEAEVCVEMVDPFDSRRWPIGCRTIGAALDAEVAAVARTSPSVDGSASDPADVVWGAVDDIVLDGNRVTATGWAHDPNDPERAVEIIVRAGGERASAMNDLDHPVARATYGIDGPAGFSIELEVPPGDHRVTVHARLDDGRTLLDAAPVSVT